MASEEMGNKVCKVCLLYIIGSLRYRSGGFYFLLPIAIVQLCSYMVVLKDKAITLSDHIFLFLDNCHER